MIAAGRGPAKWAGQVIEDTGFYGSSQKLDARIERVGADGATGVLVVFVIGRGSVTAG